MQEGPIATNYIAVTQATLPRSLSSSTAWSYIPCPLHSAASLTQPLFWKPQRGLGLDSSQGMLPLDPGLSLYTPNPSAYPRALLKPTATSKALRG